MLILLAAITDEKTRSKLEMIYNAYSDAMYYRAYGILHNSHDAEDVVQGAFVKILENIDKLEQPISNRTRSFALIVTENKAIDLYRKKKKYNEVELEDDLVEENQSFSYEGDNLITEQILKLKPKYRNVLILKYVHGYNYAEIAQITDTTEESAKKTGQRAREKLEQMCKELGII
ncbi:MAG: RNA polymerase sigma factor [Acetatifactor sp.]|nr:RNA polymerase sigma factor [Acetatifactor sp.]